MMFTKVYDVISLYLGGPYGIHDMLSLLCDATLCKKGLFEGHCVLLSVYNM